MEAAPIGTTGIYRQFLHPLNRGMENAAVCRRKGLRLTVTLMLVILLSSCQPVEFSTAEELTEYVGEPANNLSYESKLSDLTISVSYKPNDLVVYQELGDSPADYNRLINLQKKYEGYYFFVLRFSHDQKDLQAAGSFFEKVRNLSYNLDDYVNLTTSSLDTIYAGEFTPIRSIAADKETDILIVFKKEKSKGQEWIQFNLNEFGLGMGNQQFKFKVADLEHVPRLKFAIVS